HRLGVHCLNVRTQPLLNFFEQLLLQRLDLRQPEKLPHFIRRAIDVQLDLHQSPSVLQNITLTPGAGGGSRVLSGSWPSTSHFAANSRSNTAGSSRWHRGSAASLPAIPAPSPSGAPEPTSSAAARSR